MCLTRAVSPGFACPDREGAVDGVPPAIRELMLESGSSRMEEAPSLERSRVTPSMEADATVPYRSGRGTSEHPSKQRA
jgi:hypothetical protein